MSGYEGGRVPVPGMPGWVGYAVVHEGLADYPGGPTKLYPRVHVNRGRFLAWRVGCALGHATLRFWRSLYVREHARPALDSSRRRGGPASPDTREVHH